MNTKTITRTAILIALLIALQAATRPLANQFVTGSCVNLVLAVAAMLCGHLHFNHVDLVGSVPQIITGGGFEGYTRVIHLVPAE